MKVLTSTKSAIEALSVPEGFVAYATDTNELGSYNGASWDWWAGDLDTDYVNVTGDTMTGGLVTQNLRTLDLSVIDDGDSPYAADADDVIVVDASSGAVTIDLPALTGIAGRRYQIKCVDSTYAVTVDGDGTETIDGNTTVTLLQYDSVVLVAGSSEWHIM